MTRVACVADEPTDFEEAGRESAHILPASIVCPTWATWMVAAIATAGGITVQRLPMTWHRKSVTTTVVESRSSSLLGIDRMSISIFLASHVRKPRASSAEPAYRTTRTEQALCCTSFVETLPRKKRATAPRPLAPATIRSVPRRSATFMISSAG